jgi:hypothetical protein
MEIVDVFRRVASSTRAKRELAWLMAKCQGDLMTAQELERVDPRLRDRLRASGADIEDREGERGFERRERFARLHDECYERHARRCGLTREHIEQLEELRRFDS